MNKNVQVFLQNFASCNNPEEAKDTPLSFFCILRPSSVSFVLCETGGDFFKMRKSKKVVSLLCQVSPEVSSCTAGITGSVFAPVTLFVFDQSLDVFLHGSQGRLHLLY